MTEKNETASQTVVYIEDNPANLRLVSQILARLDGVELLTATEPVKGLELIEQCIPDLILLDINLPGMDGFEVLKKLRASNAQTPVLAISANAMPADIEMGELAGFDAYITKPVDVLKLMQTVQAFLADKGG